MLPCAGTAIYAGFAFHRHSLGQAQPCAGFGPRESIALCRHSLVQAFYFDIFLQELDITVKYSPCLHTQKDRALPQAHTCMMFS